MSIMVAPYTSGAITDNFVTTGYRTACHSASSETLLAMVPAASGVNSVPVADGALSMSFKLQFKV